MNVFAFLDKSATQTPSAPALRHGAEHLTYEEFRSRALTIAGNLEALGCRAGDRVAFCLANSPRILELVFGCFAAGLVVVPINARLHPKEIAFIVADSGARVLVHGPEYTQGIMANREAFAGLEHRICVGGGASDGAQAYTTLLDQSRARSEAASAQPEDICWLFYTSGTTGRPKGAMWNHRMVRTVVMNYLADVHNIQPGEVVLHCAPMSHGSGIVALPAVARGALNTIYEQGSFEPEKLFKIVESQRVSHIAFLAPTQIVKMVEDFTSGRYDLSSLKAICYGGAPIYVEHLRRAIDCFGPVFAQIYGQGEAPITITGLSAQAHAQLLAADDPRIGSAGQIRTDVEAHCVDETGRRLGAGGIGEVVVRGDVVMPGYWRNAEATAEALRDGWLRTGDIGYFDDRGYLFLLDRAKDTIITGGNNVYPREVEEVLVQHPAVATAVVLGVPHDYWGEAVHAVVVPEPGASVSAADLIAFCGEHLAGYKKPKAVDFVKSLPTSGYGKVLRREVRERYWEGRTSRIGGGSGEKVGTR